MKEVAAELEQFLASEPRRRAQIPADPDIESPRQEDRPEK